jgi:hypothetical protein
MVAWSRRGGDVSLAFLQSQAVLGYGVVAQHPRPDPLGDVLRRVDQRVLVDRQNATVAHDPLSADHDRDAQHRLS